jgi:hypothetical protein
MAHVTGQIEKHSILETKYGPMQIIHVQGTRYSVKESSGHKVPPLAEGDMVIFSAEQDGKWWNARGLLRLPQNPPQAAPGSPIPSQAIARQGGNEAEARERRIVRQMALKAGVEIVSSLNTSGMDDDGLWAEIVRWSNKVYQMAYHEDKWNQQVDIIIGSEKA